MKNNLFLISFILCYIIQFFGNAVVLNISLCSSFSNMPTEVQLKKFYEYAAKKNLTIELQISDEDSNDSCELLLKKNYMKKKSPFDIYIYDFKNTDILGPYLLDLKNSLPKEHIEMYDSRIIKETCIYEEELVGLVKSLTLILSLH